MDTIHCTEIVKRANPRRMTAMVTGQHGERRNLCGGELTHCDLTWRDFKAARDEALLANDGLYLGRKICPDCENALYAPSNPTGLSEARGSITPAQQNYLSALYREAHANAYSSNKLRGLDMAHLDRMSKRDASHYIDILKAAKDAGWKGDR